MNVLWGIGSYVVAVPIMAILPNVAMLAFAAVASLVKHNQLLRWLLPIAFSAAGVVFGVYCFVQLAEYTPFRSAAAMLILPAVATFSNGRRRLEKAANGTSTASRLGRQFPEGEYDFEGEKQTECGYFVGDIIGYVLGFAIFFARGPYV